MTAVGREASVLAPAAPPFGPMVHARAAVLERRGPITPGQCTEEIVVVAGTRR